MTIDKAIEILFNHQGSLSMDHMGGLRDAIKLGIEGLNKWKERHERCPDDVNFLLPGETKD